jgi:hypothetical protein
MIARHKDTGFGWKIRRLDATYTIVQHLHFFEKKSEKSKRYPKHITKNTKGGNKF